MRRPLVIVATVLALVGAACGNDNSDVSRDLTIARADTTVSGSIEVTGSSTVEPLTTLVAEAFRGQNGKVDITVEGPGTGDGFERFCGGEADITGASRPIKPEELEACTANGIAPIEIDVGRDGVAVITAPDNDVDCLTFADLYALIGVEAQGVDRWREADEVASALGSTTNLPDERLALTGPGEESGTYDAFIELVLETAGEPRVEEGIVTEDEVATTRPDYAASADDNSIIEAVAGDRGGLGWVGLSFAEQSGEVRLVPVASEPGGDCVAPTRESVQDGSYPIARELFVYVSASAAARPVVAAFVDFYLEGLAGFVEESGYVEPPDPEDVVARWEARETVS
jgi:phosphate transport system substrate-binding protein